MNNVLDAQPLKVLEGDIALGISTSGTSKKCTVYHALLEVVQVLLEPD